MSDQSSEGTTRTTPRVERSEQHHRSRMHPALTVAGLLIAVITLAGCGDDDSGDTADSGPAEVIETYRVAYNGGDIEQVMSLFSEESELTGHPLASSSTSLASIRSIQLRDMGAGAEADAYSFSNVEISGDTVAWDSVWTNSDGMEWCADGHRAVIADGRIVSWSFAADRGPCA